MNLRRCAYYILFCFITFQFCIALVISSESIVQNNGIDIESQSDVALRSNTNRTQSTEYSENRSFNSLVEALKHTNAGSKSTRNRAKPQHHPTPVIPPNDQQNNIDIQSSEDNAAGQRDQNNLDTDKSVMRLEDVLFLDTYSKNSGLISTDGISQSPATTGVTGTSLPSVNDNVLTEDALNESEIVLNGTENVNQVLPDKLSDTQNETRETKTDANGTVTNDPITLDKIPSELDVLNETIVQIQPTEGEGDTDTNMTTVNMTLEDNTMPVFSEWAQKQMEEAEKQQEINNATVIKRNHTNGMRNNFKIHTKNYASPDCGAKVIQANAESQSTYAVLSSSKDEYLLSPCTSRIWFVVELCESIQAERIDFANFELFSSSPKNFSVSISNRFPTREWSNVGRFVALDERDVQSFNLEPILFGKYVRVDVHSHYNSEHFCPISLFRVFGTSEFEAFETENQPVVDGIDYDDELHESEVDLKNKKSGDNNLFKTASDAVLLLVKKAAEALGKTNTTNVIESGNHKQHPECITTSFVASCERCSKNFSTEVNTLLSCKMNQLTQLLNVPIIRKNIYKSQICANIAGLDFSKHNCRDNSLNNIDETLSKSSLDVLNEYRKEYISHLFPVSYIVGMCNIIAWDEKRVLANNVTTTNGNVNSDKIFNDIKVKAISKSNTNDIVGELQVEKPTSEPKLDKPALEKNVEVKNETTKKNTKKEEILVKEVEELKKDVKEATEPNVVQTKETQPVSEENPIQENKEIDLRSESPAKPNTEEKVNDTPIVSKETNTKSTDSPNNWEQLDNLLFSENQKPTESTENTNNQHHNQKQQPESVFTRLTNRVKTLERNMSLSGQYLEELSKSYKKQVEELKNSFVKTLQSIEEQNRNSLEREQQLLEQNKQLREDIDNLNSYFNLKTFLIVCSFFITLNWCVISTLLKRYKIEESQANVLIQNMKTAKATKHNKSKNRRISHEGFIKTSANKNRRIIKRPSDEALNVIVHTIGDEDKQTSDGVMVIKKDNKKNSYEPEEQHSEWNTEVPTLDEEDVNYMPGNNFDYDEFVPLTKLPLENGPKSSTPTSNSKKQTKTRRLSSPAFLKSPFSKNIPNNAVTNGKKQHKSTGWEWHKTKRQQSSNSDVVRATTPKVKISPAKSASAIVNMPDYSTTNSENSSMISNDSIGGSAKELSGFRRILKKVF